MTDRPAVAAIATRRSRNFPVGSPATARRNLLPRVPRPMVSRPVTLASANPRFSMLIDAHLAAFAWWMSRVTA